MVWLITKYDFDLGETSYEIYESLLDAEERMYVLTSININWNINIFEVSVNKASWKNKFDDIAEIVVILVVMILCILGAWSMISWLADKFFGK